MLVVMGVVALSGTHTSNLAENAKYEISKICFRISMDLVGSGWAEMDPVVTCQSRL